MQYRLRAFPVPPKARDKNAATPKLYLRLEYTTLPSDGAWPLPVLAEKRNVAWDQKTQRDCNDNPYLVAANEWWPRSLAAKVAPQPAVHIFSMGPQGPSVIAQAAKTLPVTALQGKKITLVGRPQHVYVCTPRCFVRGQALGKRAAQWPRGVGLAYHHFGDANQAAAHGIV
jgi:hypothetical protein